MADRDTDTEKPKVEQIPLPLERDWFLRNLIGRLAETLEDVVGIRDAAGYISVVGTAIGEEMEEAYRLGLGGTPLSRDQIGAVLVDLKRRIKGDFFIIEQTDDKIVLGNRACPFGDRVAGRTALCMMTSNVFGHIAAQNHGYAKVELQETIARGHNGCRVVVHLQPEADAESAPGREYYQRDRIDE